MGNTQSCGCINSFGEQEIALLLQEYNINFKQQYTFDDLLGEGNGKLRFDFAIFNAQNQLQQLIEFQGEQHFIPFKYDTLESFQKRQCHDQLKREYCQKHSIPLIEINYKDRDKLNWDFLKQLLND